MARPDKDSTKDVRARSSLDPNLWMLQITGHWPPEKGSKRVRFVYWCYGFVFINVFYWLYMLCEAVNIYFLRNDIATLTTACFLFLTHLAQTVKFYHFIKYHGRVQLLIDSIDRDCFKPRNLAQKEIIEDAIKEGKFIYYGFMGMAYATCFLWAIFPFLDREADSTQLPLSAYFPFRTDYTPMFEIIFTYQMLAATINASTNISMDTVMAGTMQHIGVQLDLLNDTLRNIKQFAEERLLENKETKFQRLVHVDENERIDDDLQREMNNILVECINHHWNILEYTDEVGALFNLSVLSQFVTSAVIICITMFQLTLVSLFSLQFISMVLYQGCMLVEIFLYCWYGNEVILKSSDISLSAYSSDWTHCSIPYQKNLFILMIRSVVPIKLYAGNFFTLSVETFTAILRSSWSYFAVLNKVHDE